jgi:hypothetical protein
MKERAVSSIFRVEDKTEHGNWDVDTGVTSGRIGVLNELALSALL